MPNDTITSTCILTTFDNPYDPFEQFSEWLLFDVEKGYNTCGYIDRIAQFSDDMSQKEIDEENERAIDEILKYDFMNIYKKVRRDVPFTNNKTTGEG